ncbi:RNA polymerase sigma factor RpoD, partial [hydrothermal vent metagenome]
MADKAVKTENKSTSKQDDTTDSPLIDSSQDSIKEMIAAAKKRGYITYDTLNAALPQAEMSSEKIEDIMTMLSEMGVNVVDEADSEEAEEAPAKKAVKKKKDTDDDKPPAKVAADRTDDPVRMYLREMGSVELLSREGEIAIAKRIEAGRETMIAGLCESPLTFRALVEWAEMLEDEEILLRDVIDLDGMYGIDPSVESETPDKEADKEKAANDKTEDASKGEAEESSEKQTETEGSENEEASSSDDDDDDDDGDSSVSLAVMEE